MKKMGRPKRKTTAKMIRIQEPGLDSIVFYLDSKGNLIEDVKFRIERTTERNNTTIYMENVNNTNHNRSKLDLMNNEKSGDNTLPFPKLEFIETEPQTNQLDVLSIIDEINLLNHK